jgi:hypothetical protein
MCDLLGIAYDERKQQNWHRLSARGGRTAAQGTTRKGNVTFVLKILLFKLVSLSLLTFSSSEVTKYIYSRQTMRWSLRGVNILSAVRGEYRACRWTEDFLLVSAKLT